MLSVKSRAEKEIELSVIGIEMIFDESDTSELSGVV